MQNAYDRDEYVTIHWENIPTRAKNNFIKYNSNWVTHFNTTYDYESVMHYESYAYSTNGKPTIVPVVSEILVIKSNFKHFLIQFLCYSSKHQDKKYMGLIGQREKLSEKDIFKLNAMYECNDTTNEQ